MRTRPAPRGDEAAEFSAVLVRARDGDAAAVAALFDRYGRVVLGAVRRRLSADLRRRYDSMDLAQSVFADVLRALPRIKDRGEGGFVRLLTLKAENKVRDKLRRHVGRNGRRRER